MLLEVTDLHYGEYEAVCNCGNIKGCIEYDITNL
jgi:hypothetical protein